MKQLVWPPVPPTMPLDRLLARLNPFLRQLADAMPGRASVVGLAQQGAGAVLAQAAIPADALAARVTVLGALYNGAADTHTGYLEALWQAGSNRIRVLHDVNHGAGVDQGFALTVEGLGLGALVVRTKATATNPQSADVFVEWLR